MGKLGSGSRINSHTVEALFYRYAWLLVQACQLWSRELHVDVSPEMVLTDELDEDIDVALLELCRDYSFGHLHASLLMEEIKDARRQALIHRHRDTHVMD